MREQYPNLFAPALWLNKTLAGQFDLYTTPPDDTLIANVNIVPYVGDKWVIAQTERYPEVPGGTREPDEPFDATLRRELLEEAGATLVNTYQAVGAWRVTSYLEKPYRPHTPHPVFYRYVVTGEVTIVGAPSNPPDGEVIVSVDVVTLAEAIERFTAAGRADIADLYQLAATLRR